MVKEKKNGKENAQQERKRSLCSSQLTKSALLQMQQDFFLLLRSVRKQGEIKFNVKVVFIEIFCPL